MKKHIVCILLACFFMLNMSACKQSQINADYNLTEQTPAEYELLESSFVDSNEVIDKSISIYYPQIRKLKNEQIEQDVNNQIEKLALSGLDDFISLEKMDIKTTYLVTLATNNIISIRFIIESFHMAQSYPLIRIKTLNINMLTGKRIELKDLVNIDANFVDSFFKVFKNQREYENEQTAELIDNYVKDFISLEELVTCDEKSNVEYSSYLTDDSLGISIAVPHSGGSYTLYEAKYSEIFESGEARKKFLDLINAQE